MLGCINLVLLRHRFRDIAELASEKGAISLLHQSGSIFVAKCVDHGDVLHQNDGVVVASFDKVCSILNALNVLFGHVDDCVGSLRFRLVRDLSVEYGTLDAIDITVRVIVKLDIGWV